MIRTKSGLKIYFKHIILSSLIDKAFRQANKSDLYGGFALDAVDIRRFLDLTNNKLNGRTTCIIEKHGDLLAMGEAKCSSEDNYRKEMGCYKSLADATKDFDKETRRELFEAFENRKKPKKTSLTRVIKGSGLRQHNVIRDTLEL